jgi:hypothetical protein
MMIATLSLTDEAQRCFDRYLERVRHALSGTSIDAREVENDVREHIATALGGQTEVSRHHLEGVLEDLGSPESWVPEEQRPVWRRVIEQLRTGPEDWRLAYLTLALTVLGVACAPLVGPLGLLAAYLTARAARALAAEHGDELGARRWLIDPVLVAAAGLVIVVVALAPAAGLSMGILESGAFADQTGIAPLDAHSSATEIVSHIAMYVIVTGCWWIVLAPLATWALRPLRWLTHPVGDRLERRHLIWLAALGFGLVVIGATTLTVV